jgi:hypothetical protein
VTLDPVLSFPVAVVAERRPGVTPWQDHVWRVVAVQEEVPPIAPWTLLRQEAGRELYFAGEATVTLHRTDTPNFKENLEAERPLIWAVLRPAETPSGMEVAFATVDPGEAEVFSEAPRDTLEALPMPPGIRALLEAFVAEHHVERQFHKRKRDRADTEALGRRPGGLREDDAG